MPWPIDGEHVGQHRCQSSGVGRRQTVDGRCLEGGPRTSHVAGELVELGRQDATDLGQRVRSGQHGSVFARHHVRVDGATHVRLPSRGRRPRGPVDPSRRSAAGRRRSDGSVVDVRWVLFAEISVIVASRSSSRLASAPSLAAQDLPCLGEGHLLVVLPMGSVVDETHVIEVLTRSSGAGTSAWVSPCQFGINVEHRDQRHRFAPPLETPRPPRARTVRRRTSRPGGTARAAARSGSGRRSPPHLLDAVGRGSGRARLRAWIRRAGVAGRGA